MKLLIVDDEELTRTGVISSIDWTALGIEEVLQADDGMNGLEMARLHKPEIILCDVRMPRMDGIVMLERLESIIPDTVPIFMSGYSDKEYLKAAIKLKAVNYIEKPLDPEEIRAAVLEARELYNQKLRSHQGETLHSMETASRLAMLLTTPYETNSESISQLAGELSLRLTPGTFFTAFIVKLDAAAELSAPLPDERHQAFQEFLKYYHLDCIHVEKHTQYIVYYVFGTVRPSETIMKSIGDFLCRQYTSGSKFFIVAGEAAAGISKAYQSYTSAVILLQSCFFFPAGTFLAAEASSVFSVPDAVGNVARMRRQSSASRQFPPAPEKSFGELLSSKDKDGCTALLDVLFTFYDRNPDILPNQVKDLYYKLFIVLEDIRRQQQLMGNPEQGNIVDTLEKCFTFQELHQTLLDKTEAFFIDAQNAVTENPTIFLIKDYIGKNYMNETLSVKDISAHVFLSASYVCTFFKNETGQTLNQFLTEYRMEKAKQLLGDSRYKITDISSKVGYSDGNYFGKSFKKYTGFSPSEYREKMT